MTSPASAPSRRYPLTGAEAAGIFEHEIVPQELEHARSQQLPFAVFVVGQPGAGVDRTARFVREHLDRERGGAAEHNPDFYRAYFPVVPGDRSGRAAAAADVQTRRWADAAHEWITRRRTDAVIALKDPADLAARAAQYRAAGYRTEAVVMAVPEAQSRLAQLVAHQRLVATGMDVPPPDRRAHDAAYAGTLQAAAAIDNDRVVDVVRVLGRDGRQSYVNRLQADGTWASRAGALTAVETERHREWSSQERAGFAGHARELARDFGPALQGELADVVRRAPVPTATQTPPTTSRPPAVRPNRTMPRPDRGLGD